MKALITGGSRGLGKALVDHYLNQGFEVVTVSRKPVQQSGVISLSYDLSDQKVWNPFFDEVSSLGQFDLVINNLGVNKSGLLCNLEPTQVERTLDINFTFPMLLTQNLMNSSAVVEGGAFVFINTLGHFSSYPSSATYVASKSGLHSFVSSMRTGYGHKYQFTSVYPGPLDTDQARENSPLQENHNRLNPHWAAKKIAEAVEKGNSSYVPSLPMKGLTMASRIYPGFMEKMMKKTLLDPFLKKD